MILLDEFRSYPLTCAIVEVLEEEGKPLHYKVITARINAEKGTDYLSGSVNSLCSQGVKFGLFEREVRGTYALAGTTVTAPHSHKAVGGKVPVAVRPCALYGSDNPAYKKASSFIDSPVPSQDEKDLLELIVNFQLSLDKEDSLDKEEVCFADILNDLEVVFSDEDKKRDQDDIDKDFLQEKLDELKTKIEITKREKERNPSDSLGDLLNRMKSAAKTAQDLLDGASGDKVLRLGEFIRPERDGLDKPKVVIYYKNIESFCGNYSERWKVMAGVFVHEMFHAWNYFRADKNPRSVLVVDEPMVEFGTLYFLKELGAFTSSEKVLRVSWKYEGLVHDKQQSIGDVAAYGFGYYLFKKLSKSNVDSIKWIDAYSKKSAFIDGSNKLVGKAEKALIPIYPFRSESEADVLNLFKKIIFNKRVIPASAEELDATKTGSHVSLRDLVLACIETIGRKCFDEQELYAFAPIFKACMPHSSNLEEALKQQLDELVKSGVLDALPHDCYSRK